MLEDKIMMQIHVMYVNCIDYFEKENIRIDILIKAY